MISRSFKVFGLICSIVAIMLLWQRNNPRRVAFDSVSFKKNYSNKTSKNQPTRLVIKNLNIDLPIIPAKINGQKWQTTTKGASWLSQTPSPGEKGNSIIYGHNWENILGALVRAKPGNKIEISYNDGAKKTFVIASTAVVSPKNVSVLNQSKDQKITLYTCTGLFDEKRFVVVALAKKDL